MTTPGITIKPIVDMTGAHHFNEVFFDGVRIPQEALVGEKDPRLVSDCLTARLRTQRHRAAHEQLCGDGRHSAARAQYRYEPQRGGAPPAGRNCTSSSPQQADGLPSGVAAHPGRCPERRIGSRQGLLHRIRTAAWHRLPANSWGVTDNCCRAPLARHSTVALPALICTPPPTRSRAALPPFCATLWPRGPGPPRWLRRRSSLFRVIKPEGVVPSRDAAERRFRKVGGADQDVSLAVVSRNFWRVALARSGSKSARMIHAGSRHCTGL